MKDLNNYEAAEKIGLEIAKRLHLKPLRNTRDGRKLFETTYGEKTAAGLARSVSGLFENVKNL